MTMEQNYRKILNDYLVELSVFNFNGRVDDVIKMLENYRNEYTADGYFDIYISADHYYDTVSIELRGERYETDGEYEKRMKAEKVLVQKAKDAKKQQEADERKMYERLKKKYG